VSAEGGTPRRLTKEPFENITPSWSRDGRWIYFSSDRAGTSQIWKVALMGGPAIQVTTEAAIYPFESHDGKYIYYWCDGIVHRKLVEGGSETLDLRLGGYECWTVLQQGICFMDFRVDSYKAMYFDFATSRIKNISKIDIGLPYPRPPEFSAWDVSPDGKWIYYGRRELAESDIILLEGFN